MAKSILEYFDSLSVVYANNLPMAEVHSRIGEKV